jgi:hypothetical protein
VKAQVGHWIGCLTNRSWRSIINAFESEVDPKISAKRFKQSTNDKIRLKKAKSNSFRKRTGRKSQAAKEASKRKAYERRVNQKVTPSEPLVVEKVETESKSVVPRQEPAPLALHSLDRDSLSNSALLFVDPWILEPTDTIGRIQELFYESVIVDLMLTDKPVMAWPDDFDKSTIRYFRMIPEISTNYCVDPDYRLEDEFYRLEQEAAHLDTRPVTGWHEVWTPSKPSTMTSTSLPMGSGGVVDEIFSTHGGRAIRHRHVPWCLKRKGLSLKQSLAFFRDRSKRPTLRGKSGKIVKIFVLEKAISRGLSHADAKRSIQMLPCGGCVDSKVLPTKERLLTLEASYRDLLKR